MGYALGHVQALFGVLYSNSADWSLAGQQVHTDISCKVSETLTYGYSSVSMGTHLRVLIESYPMNTNITGFRWLSKTFTSLSFTLDKSSLKIGRVNLFVH